MLLTTFLLCSIGLSLDDQFVTYEGTKGPGAGKTIVLISGDEEYRSEEAMPELGQILATQHGFRAIVLFAIDPKTGEIDPNNRENIPGLEALEDADLMIIATRFRELPDDQMKYIDDYVQSGKPIIGIRTATHAFNNSDESSYSNYRWNSSDWKGGFGKQVLGETWVNHHGAHKSQSTRGIIAPDAEDHPITRGIKDGAIWGPTDVYGIRLPLPEGSEPIILGQVLEGMNSDDSPLEGPKNDPMMPVAWTRTYENARIFTTTMGSSTDFENSALRRLLVNACYWCLEMEEAIPASGSSARIVGSYKATPYGFNEFQRGLRPTDFKLREQSLQPLIDKE